LENLDFSELTALEEEQLVEARKEFLAPPQEPPEQDRTDEMLRQALLAAELSEQTGQMVFAFEEGNPLPVNLPKQQKPAETEIAPPPAPRRPRSMAPAMLYPQVPTAQRLDYRITNDHIGEGTPLDRFYHNIRAIQLLKKLET
jgi:hypothetical protein